MSWTPLKDYWPVIESATHSSGDQLVNLGMQITVPQSSAWFTRGLLRWSQDEPAMTASRESHEDIDQLSRFAKGEAKVG